MANSHVVTHFGALFKNLTPTPFYYSATFLLWIYLVYVIEGYRVKEWEWSVSGSVYIFYWDFDFCKGFVRIKVRY